MTYAHTINYPTENWERYESLDDIPFFWDEDEDAKHYGGVAQIKAGKKSMVVYFPTQDSYPVPCHVENCGNHVRVYIPEGY